jgi:hypothetical protein
VKNIGKRKKRGRFSKFDKKFVFEKKEKVIGLKGFFKFNFHEMINENLVFLINVLLCVYFLTLKCIFYVSC